MDYASGFTAAYREGRTDLQLIVQLARTERIAEHFKIAGAEYFDGGGGCDVAVVTMADGQVLSIDDWAMEGWGAFLYADRAEFDLGYGEGACELTRHVDFDRLPAQLTPAAALAAFALQADVTVCPQLCEQAQHHRALLVEELAEADARHAAQRDAIAAGMCR